MDSAADGLLALSNTAAAMVDEQDLQLEDSGSSSLSELEDAPENPELEADNPGGLNDGDSEAETERMDPSPEKQARKVFETSPSKLAQSTTVDDRPEIEALTNTELSSPMTPVEDSAAEDEPSDNEDLVDKDTDTNVLASPTNERKRKRLGDDLGLSDGPRIRRRRAASADSDEEKSDAESEGAAEARTREPTLELTEDIDHEARSDKEDDIADDEPQHEQADSSDTTKEKKLKKSTRARSRRGKNVEIEPQDGEDENDVAEGSDDDVEADDMDAAAKSEEEQARRAAAMEALTALERHFATLRDKLYDEKIAQINHELAQLAEPRTTHPELMRQIECVERHRDEKFETEQKLLVYKIGALKRKSIAERATINSSYLQTARDIREQHLERMSEHFYRIQRERFKSSQVIPSYTIPFPERKPQQILQQTAYNKEVSILSGMAKYVGFPAAPELPSSLSTEVEDDMDKMGITIKPARVSKPAQRQFQSNYGSTISAPAAGEQFLEQTPWANPNHPIHRMNRQGTNRSPMPVAESSSSYLTPANQQKTIDTSQPVGSASTIAEIPSAPASSVLNTPQDLPAVASNGAGIGAHVVNGYLQNYRQQSASPTETRRALSPALSHVNAMRSASQPRNMPGSSPLQSRMSLLQNATGRAVNARLERASQASQEAA